MGVQAGAPEGLRVAFGQLVRCRGEPAGRKGAAAPVEGRAQTVAPWSVMDAPGPAVAHLLL